jgi:tRNA A37 threonylcarbamoyladenosine modification protein TsaB
MILTLVGNDITHLTLGLVNDDRTEFVPSQTIPCAPEDYIGIIDGFLQAHELDLGNVKGIVVSSADGSATALRVSHAIANAWGFARGIPLYRSLDSAPLAILLPAYSTQAKVTVRKKDALHRKT